MTTTVRDQRWVEDIAKELDNAERTRVAIDPLTSRWPDMTIEEAYAIQTAWIKAKLGRGAKVVGHKIGLTSLAIQQALGVDQPDYGHILDTMMVAHDAEFPAGELIAPRIEGEIAFRMAKSLKGPGVTERDVLAATKEIVPALEVIDSRIKDWKIKIADTIADNASSARVVLGARAFPVDAVDMRLVGMLLKRNGQIVQTGAGGAVLGHPATSVAWLVNRLGELGITVEAGTFVMSGALTAPIPVGAGMTIEAEFDRLGAVRVRFR